MSDFAQEIYSSFSFVLMANEQIRDKKATNDFLSLLNWWSIDKKEIEEEVNKYSSLGITKSARGLSFLIILGLIAINIVSVFFGISAPENLYEIALYLPLGFLIYKGNRLAIIATMLLWTVDKAISLISMGTGQTKVTALIMIFIWWAVVMRFLYGALKVENLKRKLNLENKTKSENHFYKKPLNVAILLVSIVVVLYFGTLIVKEVLPKSNSEKQMECLKLGSDFARRRCLLIVGNKNTSLYDEYLKSNPQKDCGIFCDLIPNK